MSNSGTRKQVTGMNVGKQPSVMWRHWPSGHATGLWKLLLGLDPRLILIVLRSGRCSLGLLSHGHRLSHNYHAQLSSPFVLLVRSYDINVQSSKYWDREFGSFCLTIFGKVVDIRERDPSAT